VTTKADEDELLRSVALQNVKSIRIARQRAEQRQEAYLAEAQRLSHTGSFGWRVSTGEIIWSEETSRIFQYDRTTTPTVESVLQRVHPEDAAQVKQTIERASQDGKDFEHEYRLVMPDGSVKHVHVVAHVLRDESGSVEFVGAVMDTTESKRAEEALRRSESYLAEAQRLTHTGSWAFNAITPLYWSEENFRIWGFDPQQGLPARAAMLQRIHPEDRDRVVECVQNAVRERGDYAVEFRIVLPDGSVRFIHGLGHTAFSASGELVEVVGTNVDVTERKRAEILLGGEKRLLEMIARGDSRALILEALCRLVEELASGALSSILLLDPKANRLRHGAAPGLPIKYTEAIDGLVIGPCVGSCGSAAYRAEPVIVSDIASDPLWADFRDLALAHGLRACWSTPILSSAGKVLGTFAIYYREPRSPTPQDHNLIEQITHLASIALEREQAEEALRQAQAELAHMTRLTTMGELTASIAHEVNQPLTAVVNNANACISLLDSAPKRPGEGGLSGASNLEEVREALTEIIDDADRAGAVILRVRQLARKAPFERTLLNLRDVITDVFAHARYESTTRRVTIRTELPEELPTVLGDRVQLQQVLLNLIVNGMDAMDTIEESKRVLLICGRLETRDGMPGALLSVQDSGTGLKPEEMDRLFEAFYTTKPQGMGIGLAISRSIIEAHGGRLWAEPNQGPGATFLFSLPAAPKHRGEGGPHAGNAES
jgi:PAS domain S-box-containing protein